jgi:hypothetical protein
MSPAPIASRPDQPSLLEQSAGDHLRPRAAARQHPVDRGPAQLAQREPPRLGRDQHQDRPLDFGVGCQHLLLRPV